MEASVFIKHYNANTYDNLELKEFISLPKIDEFISVKHEDKDQFFQVIAVHHPTGTAPSAELYAVQTDPTWELKKTGTIGFNF